MSTSTVYVETVHTPAGDPARSVWRSGLDGRQPMTEAIAEMAGALTAHYSLILSRIVRDFRTR